MKNKFKIPQIYFDLIKLFIINFFIFEILRLFFVIRYRNLFSFSFFKDTLKAFYLGPKFDFSISAYIFLFFIFIDLFFFFKKKFLRYRKIYIYAISLFFLVIFFLQLVNLEFYAEYNSHLNYTALEYLNSADMILFMIIKQYPVFRYLFIFLALAILYFFLIKKFILSKKFKKNYILSKILYLPLMLFFFIFLLRGGLSVSIINWGDAFFSSHNIVNQVTLNPIFNLLKDVYYINKTKKDYLKDAYFKDNQEAIQYVQSLVFSPKDSLIDEEYPFYRKTKREGLEKKYNVVILLMEEFSAEFVGCFGNKLNLSPNFDKLSQEGVLFDNFYSNGQRTNKGISATMCSFPPLAGPSIMNLPNGQQKITTIANLLKEKGYKTYFFYGGDANYDNMKGFFIPKGIDNFFDLSSFDNKNKLNKWGVSDGEVFDKLLEEFDKTNNTPFFAIMLSLTNHPPYSVPDEDYGGKVETGSELDDNYNTFKYVDFKMGQFFQKIKNKPYFENTIFIILGDHSKTLHHDFDFDYRKSFVPCLYYAPKILSPKKKSRIYGQIDIAPTIFYLLNMSVEHSFFGKNMFEENEDNFAYIIRNTNFAYLNKDFFFTGSFERKEKFLYKYKDFSAKDYKEEYPNETEELLKKTWAIQQVSLYLFENRLISK